MPRRNFEASFLRINEFQPVMLAIPQGLGAMGEGAAGATGRRRLRSRHNAGRARVMEERRRVQRTRTLKSARILFSHSASVIDCTVRNLTNLGACLHVANSFGMPERFDLVFDSIHARRPCRVIWRTDERLGVSFE